jgi:hypothetical protein
MKTLKFFLILVIILLSITSIINAQCKIIKINENTTSTKSALLGDGNSAAYISILKIDSIYLMYIDYERGMVNGMEINDTTPLIFYFDSLEKLIIYPVSKSVTQMISDFILPGELIINAIIGAKEIKVHYKISKEQLEILAVNVPNDIRLYYITEKKPRYTDNYGNYWNLMKFEWHYKKRLVDILQCAIKDL